MEKEKTISNKKYETQKEYIENIIKGDIIAFRTGKRVISGKVIHYNKGFKRLKVETMRGDTLIVPQQDVMYVKEQDGLWPKHVWDAFQKNKEVDRMEGRGE